MQSELNNLEKQMLQLSKKDRGWLAEKLLLSIDEDSLNEVDESWIIEAERRYDDYISGKISGISGKSFFTEIKKELGW